MKSKKELRSEILARRRQLSPSQVAQLSGRICRILMERNEFGNCDSICLYAPINNEVDPMGIREAAWRAGKRLWLPKVSGDTMEFVSYQSDTKLIRGAFNILEPERGEVLVPDNRSMVLMPGAVFDESRNRIGYGGGYYDKYLEQHPEILRVALCYDFQILEEIPSEEHDIKPQLIVSELRAIK